MGKNTQTGAMNLGSGRPAQTAMARLFFPERHIGVLGSTSIVRTAEGEGSMTEKPKPWKQCSNESLWLSAVFECPDCKRTVLTDDIEDYTFCPICGKRRYEDENGDRS